MNLLKFIKFIKNELSGGKKELSGNFLCRNIKAGLHYLPLPIQIPQPKSLPEGKLWAHFSQKYRC